MRVDKQEKRPGSDSGTMVSGSYRSRLFELTALTAFMIILISPLIYLQRDSYSIGMETGTELRFVGSPRCGECHQAAYDKWRGSHHDLAMDIATEETVLGDFKDARYTDPHNQVTSHFFRQDDKFMVTTEGPEGLLETFEITHVFGVYPLQQYLVPFPGGRLQCLNIAWDTRDNRWYRLPPYEVKNTEDWLHWTRGGQTWNGMCAECHSTGLVKNYDMEQDGYRTSWFEIDVGCESCHGPGSRHDAWATKPPLARRQVDNGDLVVATSGITSEAQIALCAPCHSRRFQLGDNSHMAGDVLDKLVPSLLDEGLYFPDGQILEEVYVYGSYVQSKMYRHGVRCSDCHDVHSLELHREGNDICLQCHRAEEYDRYEHHFHKREHEGKPSDGHLCVKCHMPGRTYMGIDYRPDHSFRVPRPDLTLAVGTPNACNRCHVDQSATWAVRAVDKHHGKRKPSHYGRVLDAGRKRLPGAVSDLARLSQDQLYPAIVRATALLHLAGYTGAAVDQVFSQALSDEEAMLRHSAVRYLPQPDPRRRLALLSPLLYDPVRGVRMEAAARLSDVPPNAMTPNDRQQFDKALGGVSKRHGADRRFRCVTPQSGQPGRESGPDRHRRGTLSKGDRYR